MKSDFDVQVPKELYYGKYDSVLRFISYFHQIDLTKRLNPKKVLEIGVGNKTVSNCLRQYGFDITTCDFDTNLEPDCIADIRNLPFKDSSYDLVLAYEILEHLPWQDVDKALGEISRVTKKYANISVPYSSAAFELVLAFPLMDRLFKKPFIDLFFRIPYFFRGMLKSPQHYWVIGRRGYSIWKVRKLLRKRFNILRELRPVLIPSHHFFVLEKR